MTLAKTHQEGAKGKKQVSEIPFSTSRSDKIWLRVLTFPSSSENFLVTNTW